MKDGKESSLKEPLARYEYEVEAEDEDGAIEKALDEFHSSTIVGISYWDQLLE